jgi:hypothetical protein
MMKAKPRDLPVSYSVHVARKSERKGKSGVERTNRSGGEGRQKGVTLSFGRLMSAISPNLEHVPKLSAREQKAQGKERAEERLTGRRP